MDIRILSYEDHHKQAFKELNKAWIDAYFVMEEEDYKALDHPRETILDPGGEIFIAEYKGKVVGVCALMKMNHGPFDFELAKMGVAENMQGNGIGYKLGRAVIEKAKALGGKTLFLETNTVLIPAINLYKKLGFQIYEGYNSPYARSNFQMLLNL